MEFHKILVPVRGDSSDDEAIKVACSLAKQVKGKIFVVNVIEVQRSLPLGAEIDSESRKAESVLNHAEDVAADYGYEVETDLLQARETGPAIVDEAVERGVNLIVMGATYKKRFGVFNLGSTVFSVLKEAPCHVILCHAPMG